MNGNVKFFNEMKGFGFIAGEDGTEYFVHQTGIAPGVTLHENDAVSFDVEDGDRGPKAVNVKKAEAGAESSEPAEQSEQPEASDEEQTEEQPEEENQESEE